MRSDKAAPAREKEMARSKARAGARVDLFRWICDLGKMEENTWLLELERQLSSRTSRLVCRRVLTITLNVKVKVRISPTRFRITSGSIGIKLEITFA